MPDIEKIFSGEITEEQYHNWLNQFEPKERPIIERLVRQFLYFGAKSVATESVQLLKNIANRTGAESLDLNTTWFVPVGYVAKSGSVIAYMFRTKNDIPLDRFISLADIPLLNVGDHDTIILLDDFLGSGAQALDLWSHIERQQKSPSNLRYILAVLVAYESGIDAVTNRSGLQVIANRILTNTDKALSPDNKAFSTPRQRKEAERIIKKYGKIVYPEHPEGYQNSQSLIGFFYSTPNNTLPIFWSTAGAWKPLLPRSDSFRDPSFLIGPPPYLSRQVLDNAPKKPIVDIRQLDELELEPEILVALFSEFRTPSIVLTLGTVFRKLEVSPQNMLAVLKLVRELTALTHEKQFVPSSIAVRRNDKEPTEAGPQVFSPLGTITLNDIDELKNAANQLSQADGVLFFSNDGYLLGGYLIDANGGHADEMVPSAYSEFAKLSDRTNSLVIYFSANEYIHMFFDSQRILLRRGVSWHLQAGTVKNAEDELSREHQVKKAVISRAIQIALELSDRGQGALITIGDHDSVLKYCDTPKTGSLRWKRMNVISSNVDPIVALASQDGATIINSEGEILQAMTALRPPTNVTVHEEVGKGTRHSTAAKISKVTNAVVFAVSVDGRITVYSHGAIKFKVMG